MKNSKQTAFGYGFTTADGSSHVEEKGLTKREYFAGLAMQGFLARPFDSIIHVAEASVKFADALLKELDNTTHQSEG